MLKKFAPLALSFALFAAGCATGHPKIAELKYNPSKYHDRTVTVDGVVTTACDGATGSQCANMKRICASKVATVTPSSTVSPALRRSVPGTTRW